MHFDGDVLPSNIVCTVFVKNLCPSIDDDGLHEIFDKFGTIKDAKVLVDLRGERKGHGFVTFDTEAAAQLAIQSMHGEDVQGRPVYVGPYQKQSERDVQAPATPVADDRYCNVYVKNLSTDVSEEFLAEVFGAYGTISSVVVMRDPYGRSRGFGFVNFEKASDAMKATVELDGYKHSESVWSVTKALSKAERENEARFRLIRERKEKQERLAASNLYVKNLEETVDDDKLRSIFQSFGNIISCRVLRDETGRSRCVGFVQFSTVDEASAAIAGMNARQVGSKPIYVAVAQRKDRQKQQQVKDRFAHSFAQPMVPPYVQYFPPVGGMPPFYFGGSAQLFPVNPYAGAAGVPGNFARMVPGTVPAVPMSTPLAVPPMSMSPSGFYVNMWGPQDGMLQTAYTQPSPFSIMPNGRALSITRSKSVGSSSSGSRGSRNGQTASSNTNGFGGLTRSESVASALQTAPAEQHRNILGEALYPIVEKLADSIVAPKITGMLLEMDEADVLKLMEEPDVLEFKVREAVVMLRGTPGLAGSRAASADAKQLGKIEQAVQELAF